MRMVIDRIGLLWKRCAGVVSKNLSHLVRLYALLSYPSHFSTITYIHTSHNHALAHRNCYIQSQVIPRVRAAHRKLSLKPIQCARNAQRNPYAYDGVLQGLPNAH